MSIESKVLVLSETAAHILRLYVEATSAHNNKGVAPENYVPYHATDDDQYDEDDVDSDDDIDYYDYDDFRDDECAFERS